MMEEVEAWEEAVDGKCLLDEIEGLLRRFVVLPKWAPETLALWIVHTYAFLLRDIALLWIVVLVVRDVLVPARDVVRVGDRDDPAGGPLDGAADRWSFAPGYATR